MSKSRLFECSNCGAFGKIVLKSEDHTAEDIVYCPACGADIDDEVTDEELDE